MDKPLKSVMRGQCDARPTLTFPAAGHHRLLTGTKFTAWLQCKQLAQDCCLKTQDQGSNCDLTVTTPMPPGHTTMLTVTVMLVATAGEMQVK